MSVGFKNITKCQIKEAISAAATTIKLQNTADYVPFISNPGTYVYGVLRDHQNFEIVKITVASSTVNGLSVARGQEGSTAKAWIRGTLFYQDVSAAALGDFQQKGTYRTVEYNPNRFLAPAHAGEKIYQNDLTACKKRWWKSFNATDPYWALVAGTICEGEELFYPDPFPWPIIIELWSSHFDNTNWQVDPDSIPLPQGSWDGSKWDATFQDELGYATGYYLALETEPIAFWYVDFRPTLARVTHNGGADVSFQIRYVGGGRNAVNPYTSLAELSLSNIGDNDIAKLFMYSTAAFSVTNIEFYG